MASVKQEKMTFDVFNFDQFVTQHMSGQEPPFFYQSNALQIYPLSIASTFIKPPIPLFRASYNFLLLFSNGGGQQQVDNKILTLNANDALFIREGHLNGIKSIDPTTDGYFIYIDNSSIPHIFSDRSLLNRFTFNPKHSISKNDMNWICECCKLLSPHGNNTILAQETYTALIRVIVLKLAENWPANWNKPDRPSEITMQFKELLYANFMSNKDVRFYAETLTVSENYLNRCVKRVTSKPPKQHIHEQIINHSKILLKDQSKDIAQIAFDLNFSDPSYFSRLFKQMTRCTPSQYRSRILQDLSG
ncbi:MAG: helix-turn-helix domain-containing protein [Phaeodactylibacter sp.]|jgi:AraC-like DNA-binding protein|nr:helix-turn-helix domain-containing protein [Phaeodactylibacter sp.]